MTDIRFPPPPRRVPLSLRITMILNAAAQFGWVFVAFGSGLFWQMVMRADYSFFTERGRAAAHVRGVVTSVEETSSKEGKTRVMANHYRFTLNGRELTGTSYSTGTKVSPGESVDIEYPPGDPTRSKIAGMRRSTFGPIVAFLTLFPIAGLVIAIRGMRSGATRAALLRDGILITGKLESKQPTQMRQNRRTVYLLTFSFVARDGRKYAVSATTVDTERLEDEPAEAVLYDPENPDRAFLVDEMPSRPQLDEMGEFKPRVGAAVAALILPVTVTLGNLIAAL